MQQNDTVNNFLLMFLNYSNTVIVSLNDENGLKVVAVIFMLCS